MPLKIACPRGQVGRRSLLLQKPSWLKEGEWPNQPLRVGHGVREWPEPCLLFFVFIHQAMNVLHEAFLIPGFRAALGEIHLQLFIPSLTQVLYVMQLELPEALKARQEAILKGNPQALSFQRYLSCSCCPLCHRRCQALIL